MPLSPSLDRLTLSVSRSGGGGGAAMAGGSSLPNMDSQKRRLLRGRGECVGEVRGGSSGVWEVMDGGGHSGRDGEGEEGGEGAPSPVSREGLLGRGSPSHAWASLARRRAASRAPPPVTSSEPTVCGGCRAPSGEAGGVGDGARGGEVVPAPPCPAGGLKITVPVLESPPSSEDVVPDDVLGGDTPPTGEVHSGDALSLGPAASSAVSAAHGATSGGGRVVVGWSAWGTSRCEARSLSEVVREPTLPCRRRQRVRVEATTPRTPPPSLTTLPALSRLLPPLPPASRALSLRVTRVPSRRASPSWLGQPGRSRRGLACAASRLSGDAGGLGVEGALLGAVRPHWQAVPHTWVWLGVGGVRRGDSPVEGGVSDPWLEGVGEAWGRSQGWTLLAMAVAWVAGCGESWAAAQ
ncbi:hypothetical protein E2C01_002436 [Portunus trituberculatus]|uniref:Uncharacterized protein n=1 Tax=Portunus trituberculatus TaxID=210409 RepID=A0A5B7CJX8_PORTR|nr:hypothetical protein [Portunus trituberculatus]